MCYSFQVIVIVNWSENESGFKECQKLRQAQEHKKFEKDKTKKQKYWVGFKGTRIIHPTTTTNTFKNTVKVLI